MGKVLVLDDEQYRHDGFAKHLAGEDITHVYTAGQAKDALLAHRFDAAYLDHDLGAYAGNGRQVADFIAEMPPDLRPRMVIVHSFNWPAASLMVATLKAAGVPSRAEPYRASGEVL